jgi:hypothetical protein
LALPLLTAEGRPHPKSRRATHGHRCIVKVPQRRNQRRAPGKVQLLRDPLHPARLLNEGVEEVPKLRAVDNRVVHRIADENAVSKLYDLHGQDGIEMAIVAQGSVEHKERKELQIGTIASVIYNRIKLDRKSPSKYSFVSDCNPNFWFWAVGLCV